MHGGCADGVLTFADREVLVGFLACRSRDGDYLVSRVIAGDREKGIALYYDGELIAYGKPGALVVASDRMSEAAARVRDEVVCTARSFGAGVRFARHLAEMFAEPRRTV